MADDTKPDAPAAKKTSATTSRKTAPRKTAPRGSSSRTSSSSSPSSSASPAKGAATAAVVASRAASQLLDLTGREAEGVTGLSRTEDGWTVQVEVIESRRIPDTTDVLALYDVDVDADGDLVGYHRVRRYVRGKPSEG